MANVSSVVAHFPTAKEGFVTTLASTISSGAATVPMNSVTGYANGDVFVGVVDPGNANKQVFTGVVDTGGVQITGVKWTEGTNVQHTAGSTVVDYVAATHMSMVSKGILEEHKQTGAHSDITADSIVVAGNVEAESFTITGAGGDQGWLSGLPVPDTITYNGNRSYDLVFNTTDLTDTVSVSNRLRITRTVTAPIQCTDLESSSSQYYSKSSPAGTTFTDDFVAGAWVKVESYTQGMIVSRNNGTSGWYLQMQANGTVQMGGYNAGAGNNSTVTSYQSLPLGKWVHVAAQLDMSAFTATTTTSYVMFDGVDVPAVVARAGTNPTALVQAGNLEVGAWNGGTLLFDGKLAQVFYSSAKITQANVRTLCSQSITSALCTTHSIVSAYTFNNVITDVNTTTANNLTAQGSALATNSDGPFAQIGNTASAFTAGTIDFGVITKTVFSTNTTLTVQVPEGCAIPTSGGITAVFYSSDGVPYGFPSQGDKWTISCQNRTQATATIAADTWANINSGKLTVPIGSWKLGYELSAQINATSSGTCQIYSTLGLAAATEDDKDFSFYVPVAPSTTAGTFAKREKGVSPTSATSYFLSVKVSGSGTLTGFHRGDLSTTIIRAEFAYL